MSKSALELEAAAKEVEAAAKAYERALDELRTGAIESGKEDLLIRIRMVEGSMKYREGISRLCGEDPCSASDSSGQTRLSRK